MRTVEPECVRASLRNPSGNDDDRRITANAPRGAVFLFSLWSTCDG